MTFQIVCIHPHHIVFLTNSIADKPSEDGQIRGDPYRTLFIARLSFDTRESDQEKEFGRYGSIERVSHSQTSRLHILIAIDTNR